LGGKTALRDALGYLIVSLRPAAAILFFVFLTMVTMYVPTGKEAFYFPDFLGFKVPPQEGESLGIIP